MLYVSEGMPLLPDRFLQITDRLVLCEVEIDWEWTFRTEDVTEDLIPVI